MNSLFGSLGIAAWKPFITALLLPPVPFLLLMLIGAWLLSSRRFLGWLLVLVSATGIWLSSCTGIGLLLERYALHVPPALSAERIRELKAANAATAIVVLGGGVESLAPEYGVSNLGYRSLERLRYGLWLSRETGLPVAFSGGSGWAQAESAAEADVAARIATQDFGRPLRWTEDKSRDTRENATLTVPMLQRDGIKHIVLVTSGVHMPRAKRAFVDIATAHGMTVEVAPMALARRVDAPSLDWLPTSNGIDHVRMALHEWLGRWMGA